MSAFTKLLPNPLTSFHPLRQHKNIARNLSDPNIREYPPTSYYKSPTGRWGVGSSRNDNLQWFTRSTPTIETQQLHESTPSYPIINTYKNSTVHNLNDNEFDSDCIPFGNPLIYRPNL